jgi:hypothetical protein
MAELVLEDENEEDDETEAPEEEKVEEPEVPTVVPLVIEKSPAKK